MSQNNLARLPTPLTAADAEQAEAQEREREAGGLRQTEAAALQPVFR